MAGSTSEDRRGASGRPSAAGRRDARDHEALPRRPRERRRRLRGGRRRGARAARRERRRQEHALEHPHRPLPAGRGRDPLDGGRCTSTRRATRSTRGSAWCTSTSGSSSRSPSPRTSSSATTAARARTFRVDPRAIERRVAELSKRYGLHVDPRARIWQLSLGEQQRVEILKALYREARDPDPRRADRRADAAGGRRAVRDAARDGGGGPDGDLHLAQAARGEGGRRPRHRAARRALDRDGRRRPTRRRARSRR